jgi:hypothetical protein
MRSQNFTYAIEIRKKAIVAATKMMSRMVLISPFALRASAASAIGGCLAPVELDGIAHGESYRYVIEHLFANPGCPAGRRRNTDQIFGGFYPALGDEREQDP